MKHTLTMILLCICTASFAQLTIDVNVVSVQVTGFCDEDSWPNGDSDPQWDIDVSDLRDYNEDFDHELTSNGPSITVSSGFDNNLTFQRTYNGVCPPINLEIDWAGFEDDAIGSDLRVEETYLWPVNTNAGTYNVSRSKSRGGCGGTVTWTINLQIIVTGTPTNICSDNPCGAATQDIQDGCASTVDFFVYEVSNSSPSSGVGAASCSFDGSDDVFFKVVAPTSGSFTMFVDDWNDYSSFTQANLTANFYEANPSCSNISVANSETVDGNSGMNNPATNNCIDISQGAFNDVNNGPFIFDNLTPGQEYYVRLTEEEDQSANVTLAFQETLMEDNCVTAQPISGLGCNYGASDVNEPDDSSWTGQAHTDGRDVNGDGNPDNIDNCNTNWFSNENMVWYYFDVTPQTVQPITITVNSIDCNSSGGGQMQMGIWKENGASCAASANASNGLGAMVPVGCSVGPSGIVEVTLPNNMPNDRYYVVVDGDAGAQCRWIFESLEVLPVEMDEFTGKAREEVNVLEWRTLSETNNSYFEIQRSADPTEAFETIGEVIGHGTIARPVNYEFIDDQPITSGYYRLKQVDYDGTFEYTDVIHILREDSKFDISTIYPNPAVEIANIKYVASQEAQLTLTVTDMLGRVVMMEELSSAEGINIHELNVNHLPKGIYTVILDDGETMKMDKIIKE